MQEKIGSYKLLQAAVSLSLNERQVFAYAIQQSIERELLLSAKETNDEKTANALFAEFETQGLVSTDIKATSRRGRPFSPTSMRALACQYLSEHPGAPTANLFAFLKESCQGKNPDMMYVLKRKGHFRLTEGRWYSTKT